MRSWLTITNYYLCDKNVCFYHTKQDSIRTSINTRAHTDTHSHPNTQGKFRLFVIWNTKILHTHTYFQIDVKCKLTIASVIKKAKLNLNTIALHTLIFECINKVNTFSFAAMNCNEHWASTRKNKCVLE